MDKNNIEASIVILTKNEENNIYDIITRVLNQQVKYAFEIIVIDSGSKDKTVTIVKNFSKVRLIEIDSKEFHHGRTRNLGASIAQGKYLVFLNGDALPKDGLWLDNLLKNLYVDEAIAGIYSRHLPKEDCRLYMALELLRGWRPIKELRKTSYLLDNDFKQWVVSLMHFSTVSCAIRKKVWEIFPFCDDLPLGEDQDWAKKILEAGYSIVYEPSSIVFHSHNRSLPEIFKYHYINALTFNSILKRKKNIFYFPLRAIIRSYSILVDIKCIRNCSQERKYNLYKMLKEMAIAVLARYSSLLGEFCGDVKSLYKPIRKW